MDSIHAQHMMAHAKGQWYLCRCFASCCFVCLFVLFLWGWCVGCVSVYLSCVCLCVCLVCLCVYVFLCLCVFLLSLSFSFCFVSKEFCENTRGLAKHSPLTHTHGQLHPIYRSQFQAESSIPAIGSPSPS